MREYLRETVRYSQICEYLGGDFLHYPPYFLGDSSKLRKRSLGCAQLDDMAYLAEIPSTDYLRLAGVGEDIASNFSFDPLG
jgi:hypothetical protein